MCACARASLRDKILMALKLKHDPAVDDVSLPKAQTYRTNCQQISPDEIDRSVLREYFRFCSCIKVF